MDDEDALMRQVAAGDTQAFDALVQACQAPLLRYALRFTGNPEAASDAVQETFLRLWRGRSAYQPRGCLRAYLFRILRSVCLDSLRTARPEVPLEDGAGAASDPADLALASGLAEAVRLAVSALPEPQRTVFLLSHYEGLSYAEIADVLGCPVGTVASRKHQATETLRRKLYSWRDL